MAKVEKTDNPSDLISKINKGDFLMFYDNSGKRTRHEVFLSSGRQIYFYASPISKKIAKEDDDAVMISPTSFRDGILDCKFSKVNKLSTVSPKQWKNVSYKNLKKITLLDDNKNAVIEYSFEVDEDVEANNQKNKNEKFVKFVNALKSYDEGSDLVFILDDSTKVKLSIEGVNDNVIAYHLLDVEGPSRKKIDKSIGGDLYLPLKTSNIRVKDVDELLVDLSFKSNEVDNVNIFNVVDMIGGAIGNDSNEYENDDSDENDSDGKIEDFDGADDLLDKEEIDVMTDKDIINYIANDPSAKPFRNLFSKRQSFMDIIMGKNPDGLFTIRDILSKYSESKSFVNDYNKHEKVYIVLPKDLQVPGLTIREGKKYEGRVKSKKFGILKIMVKFGNSSDTKNIVFKVNNVDLETNSNVFNSELYFSGENELLGKSKIKIIKDV